MSVYDPKKLIGFSDKPTLYKMILPQRGDVYVKCGADILLNGLQTDLKAEARCPICGTLTSFRVHQRQVEDLSSTDPMLHVVEFEMGPGRLRIKCESTHIFDKKDCINKWLSTYSGKQGRVTSLPEYMVSMKNAIPRDVSPA